MSSSTIAMRALTAKQKEFVRQYVLLNDARKAAAAAGYSAKRAAQEGYELLQHPAVKRELAKTRRTLLDQWREDVEMLMLDTLNCAKRNVSDYIDSNGDPIPLEKLPPDKAAAIQSLELVMTKCGPCHLPVFTDKLRAQDMVYRLVGAYAPEKKVVGIAPIDLTELYGMPEGALEPDRIEVKE